MLRDRRLGNGHLSPMRIAVVALGALAFGAAGCHSSSHGVGGSGGGGGNPHGDASGDATGSGAGGRGSGGGATGTDGGGDARGSGGASGDASTSGSGGAGATDAAGDVYGAGCNTLTPGVAVALVCAPDGGMPPAPTGGSIVPGTYRLTGLTEYGGCTPAALAQTVVITASTIETAADSTITGLSYLSATYAVSGIDLVETGTCPTTVVNNYQFSVNTTAGITTITLVSPSGLVAVFTKQ
jgi:hypothetical protein